MRRILECMAHFGTLVVQPGSPRRSMTDYSTTMSRGRRHIDTRSCERARVPSAWEKVHTRPIRFSLY